MDGSKDTGEQLEVVKQISSEVVAKVAPSEVIYFDDFFDEYARVLVDDTIDSIIIENEKDLSFSGLDLLQNLLTPSIISAVIIGISKLLEILASKRQTKNATVNFQEIERKLYELLRSRRVGKKKAIEISREFVAIVAKDQSVVLKISKWA